ncbi:hypothetical protein HAX54_052814 [Datura stramonium]|uniref:Uncharacterized protein n=1 Tax=Datura stramonium TaxID=4076 RepID=A0ABS8WRT2_DATST|nr:hypothetical protein [Datura stramonium]
MALALFLYYFGIAFQTSDVVDDGVYPLELETILDKMILFKVAVKRSNIELYDEVYIVIKISDDEDLIKRFRHSPNKDTFADPDINCAQVSNEDKEITVISLLPFIIYII